jgi:Mn-dependent DtxR family transcriptional regulator
VPRAVAETDAEGIEHHVSRATLTRMRVFLGGRQRPGRPTSGPGQGKR